MSEKAEKKLEIFIITPDATESEKYKFHGHADMVVLRCLTGDMGILPGREACSAILADGVLRIIAEDGERKLAVLGGVFHFENDVLTLITQKALLPGEIDIVTIAAQAQEYETRLAAETSTTERDKIRKELHRAKVLLNVVAK